MTTSTVPNDWMSNAAVLFIVPLITALLMRIKNNMCSSRPRLRTKYAVDLANMIATNYLALASIIIWCYMLHIGLASVVAVDMLIGIPVERWLVKVITSLDNKCYHPGGPLGKSMIHQHMRVSSVIATITRGYVVACRLTIPMHIGTPLTYWTETLLIPAMYVTVRTLAIDIDVYKPGLSRVELPTDDNTFCITSDEEIDGQATDEEQGPDEDSDITAL